MMLTKALFSIFILLLVFKNSDAQCADYCTADEQAPEEVLVEATKWACSNGADCSAIAENQPCYLPNSVKDHASYAFNSYYQKMKHNGGNCYFNAAAILSGFDPSHDSCKFDYIP